MNTKIGVASKFAYYLGVVVSVLILSFSIYLYYTLKYDGADGTMKLMLISSFAAYATYLCYIYVIKTIYCYIDLQENIVIYGNISFEKKADLQKMKYVKRKLFKRTSFIIQIDGVKYHINVVPQDTEAVEYMDSIAK